MNGTQAIDRAATLVALVVGSEDPPGFSALAEVTGLPRSTTSRLLSALERNLLLARTSDGGFVPGALFSQYAADHDAGREVALLADPVMQVIADETHETVTVTVPHGGAVVQVAQVDSQYLLSARDWSTVDVPVHCSAQGRALIAFGAIPMPKEPLERPTPRTIGTLEALTADLGEVRRRGFAVVCDELEDGLAAVAAPIFGKRSPIAAVGVSGPTSRVQPHADHIGRLLIDHAEELARLLGRRTHKEGVA